MKTNKRASRFPNAPRQIRQLPVDHRGFPVPWFVHWDNGEPDFRIIAPGKLEWAITGRKCWICGHVLGRVLAFTVGPMCVINRISSEPPAHLDCARFAVSACPFIVNPKMRRNEHNLPVDRVEPAGIHDPRNPGVMAIYRCFNFKPFPAVGGVHGFLLEMGKPNGVEWYREGARASREIVLDALDSGFARLLDKCECDDDRGELATLAAAALGTVPA